MLFVSPLFLFLCLPIFALACVFAPRSVRNVVLLTISLAFYAWAEPIFLFVVLLSAAGDWWLARVVGQAADRRIRRAAMWLGVASNGLLLGYFKYRDFLVSQVTTGHDASGAAALAANVAIPLGVSFIALEKISYLVDVYRGASKPTTLLSYLTYVFLFPKLIAGPIVKLRDVARQLEERAFRADDLRDGFVRFGYGMAKKLFIADVLGLTVDTIFASPPSWIGSAYAWLGAAAFTLQIYYDFSAYSDMAIGLSLMAGFRLRENFNMPFRATSIREFWQRWHISFYNWLSQYLFIPLNQSLARRIRDPRGAAIASSASLLFCAAASGLWHGANWTFVAWGLYTGLLLMLDYAAGVRRESAVARRVGQGVAVLSFVLGAVLFRSPTLTQAMDYYAAMFSGQPAAQLILIGNDFVVTMSVALLFAFVAPSTIADGLARRLPRIRIPGSPIVRALGFATLLVVTISRAAASSFHPFLYFRF